MTDLTTKDRLILRKLAEHPGWTPRRKLRVGFDYMQDLYFRGLVDGAGRRDHRGFGNTPDTSMWTLTDQGRETVAAFAPKAVLATLQELRQ